MANRTVIVDNNTWNNTHIATVRLHHYCVVVLSLLCALFLHGRWLQICLALPPTALRLCIWWHEVEGPVTIKRLLAQAHLDPHQLVHLPYC